MKKFGEGQQPFHAIIDIPEGDSQELTTVTDQALNSLYGELFNLLQTHGINPTATTNADLKQVARAVWSAVSAGNLYKDTGIGNVKNLSHVRAGGFLFKNTNANDDGFIIEFLNKTENTGAVTINVFDVENNVNHFNNIPLVAQNGNEIQAKALTANSLVKAYFSKEINKFVLLAVQNTKTTDDNVYNIDGIALRDAALQSVDSISALANITKTHGRKIYVASYHAGIGIGGGTFVYDATKSAINDGGMVINGWVRQIESDYYLEFWGVVSDNTDQATKIQKAIDYCQANNIKKLSAMGKGDYIINSTLVFKPTPTKVNWAYGDDRFILDLNGGNLKTTNDNLTFIKLLRDHVKLVNMGIFGTYGKKQRAVVFGYDLDETHVPNTRESVMWCKLDNIKLGGLDIGLQFNPNYGSYGMYYHKVNNIDASEVTILFYGEHTTSTQADVDAGRGSNKVTRSNFTNITHNKGACSIFFKDIETCRFDIWSEDITKDDSRLPDGKAVFAYIPKSQDYNTLAYDNHSVEIYGAVEVVTRVFNFGQAEQGIEWAVVAMGVKEDLPTAYINPHLAIDIRNKAREIKNQSLNVRVNPAAIIARPVTMLQSNTAQIYKNSYPKPNVDNYGSLVSLASTHEYSDDQFQLFASQTDKEVSGRFNFGDWFQFLTTANSFGVGSSWKMLENESLNNFRFQGGGLRIAQVLFSNGDATVAKSMPKPNHVYGAVVWLHGISPKNFDGFQILLSIDPLNIYFRAITGGTNFETGTWTPWKTVTAS